MHVLVGSNCCNSMLNSLSDNSGVNSGSTNTTPSGPHWPHPPNCRDHQDLSAALCVASSHPFLPLIDASSILRPLLLSTTQSFSFVHICNAVFHHIACLITCKRNKSTSNHLTDTIPRGVLNTQNDRVGVLMYMKVQES